MTLRRYEQKALDAGVECWCWDHLRAAGITPPRGRAHAHKDICGQVHRTDDDRLTVTSDDEPRLEDVAA